MYHCLTLHIFKQKKRFGNTKVVSQRQLQLFRDQMSKAVRDPYTVVLRNKKIPYGLLSTDTKHVSQVFFF